MTPSEEVPSPTPMESAPGFVSPSQDVLASSSPEESLAEETQSPEETLLFSDAPESPTAEGMLTPSAEPSESAEASLQVEPTITPEMDMSAAATAEMGIDSPSPEVGVASASPPGPTLPTTSPSVSTSTSTSASVSGSTQPVESPAQSRSVSASPTSAPETPLPSFEEDDCEEARSLLTNRSTLAFTANYQRVRILVQMAGAELLEGCDMTRAVMARFVNVSAAVTFSKKMMWYTTAIADGPPVLNNGSSLVGIEDIESVGDGSGGVGASRPSQRPSQSPSASPALTTNGTLFASSVLVEFVMYASGRSVGLVSGFYPAYVNSQRLVSVLFEDGHREVEWASLVGEPEVMDDESEQGTSMVRGILLAVFGSALLLGLVFFVIAEGGLTTFLQRLTGNGENQERGAILPV